MKTMIVVPSRYDSSRFPGKALYPICGVPMLLRVLHQCLKVVARSEICVVTEDDKILEFVKEHNFNVLIDKTPANSGTHKICQLLDRIPADRIINVQGDEPVMRAGSIFRMISRGYGPSGDVYQAFRFSERQDPDAVKMVTNSEDEILYFSRCPIPFGAERFREHVGIYNYSRDHLKRYAEAPESKLEALEHIEQLRFLEAGIRMRAVEVEDCWPVDSIDDVEIVERIIKADPGAFSW